MLVGRNAAVVETLLAVDEVTAAVVDGCTAMEAFACIRVRIVSTGWTARVEIPPEIQPAVKSTQDDSLDMLLMLMLYCGALLAWLGYGYCTRSVHGVMEVHACKSAQQKQAKVTKNLGK